MTDYEFVIVVCPTYGDDELPQAMEDYLQRLTVTGKKYTICELGNYYGYDSFHFGAAKIINKVLEGKGWVKSFPGLSLDSLPQIDWPVFDAWKGKLYEQLLLSV